MADETENENNNQPNDKIILINIEEEMKAAYIDYSMSVIVSRASPESTLGTGRESPQRGTSEDLQPTARPPAGGNGQLL